MNMLSVYHEAGLCMLLLCKLGQKGKGDKMRTVWTGVEKRKRRATGAC